MKKDDDDNNNNNNNMETFQLRNMVRYIYLYTKVFGVELCECEQIMKNDLIDCYREAEHGIAF